MKMGAGAGLLFISPLGKHLRYMLRLHFPASNNVAEYEALVNGLRIAIELGVRHLDARGDSQLVIDQRCISNTEGQELLQEIHSGACGHHTAPRALVENAFRQGFY
jgi:ribonuclease HI